MTRSSFMSQSVLLGADARITCSTYPDRPESGPILSISTGDLNLMISSATRGRATDNDLATARRLAEAVTAYVAEIERQHSENTRCDTSTPDTSAA
ncbi:hypothetical protein [Thermomonospora catenispora]|uniref:hypothetical protein n=1 Tax=Thermomonospora catenispora TaxID=2493090 RepID=UPI00112459FF|nr:hypothetical protein [Thermomonospora catenispora]TNY37757.1 hypothetical protein EIO00_06240 [Thermomonospora catenispora]